jgi:TrmH family RNA methyltransferase
MQKISHATTSSGLLAVFTIPDKPSLASIKPGLVLANLSDPGNAGTLMRTCAAMNVQCVVMVEGVDPWHPKVIQATAGTIAQLKIFQCTWQELVANKNNLTLHALTVSGGKAPEVIQANNALLVVGNEAHGLPEQWIADCDDAITIPMPGNTESLNAAVAGSIALYLTFKNVKI